MATPIFHSWVLLILAAAMAIHKVETKPLITPGKKSVRVINHLPHTLQLLCLSREDNLRFKVQFVQPGKEFSFSFDLNYWGTTDYWCQFHYIYASLWNQFDVWVGPGFFGTHPVPCQHCLWDVRMEGFFRGEESGKAPTFQHPWKPWRRSHTDLDDQTPIPS